MDHPAQRVEAADADLHVELPPRAGRRLLGKQLRQRTLAAQADKAVVEQGLERHVRRVGETMTERHQHREAIFPIQHLLEGFAARHRVADAKVRAMFADYPQHVRAVLLLQFDRHLREHPPECRYVFGQELHDRRKIRHHPHPPLRSRRKP
ncbi:hypothetical protein KCU90_g2302, partial [Aureobasidium melanogenum]